MHQDIEKLRQHLKEIYKEEAIAIEIELGDGEWIKGDYIVSSNDLHILTSVRWNIILNVGV